MGEGQVHTSGPDQGRPKYLTGVRSKGPNPRGTGSRPQASRAAVVALGWAKLGPRGFSPGRCWHEDGRRTDVSICHAIKHGVSHSP